MEKNLGGIYPALLTPFDKNGKVNFPVLNELIEYNIAKGVDGFYVNGSTAEVFLLSKEERDSIYREVAKTVNGRVKLIAHVGAIATEHAVGYAKVAEECGYDAVSAISPFYYKFGFEKIKTYYMTIVDNVSLPMIIYNFPKLSGVELTVDQVGQFLCDPRFIGVKHTSSDFFALQQFKQHFPNSFIFNGSDEMFLSGLAAGADGGIGSTYNFMAEKFIEIRRLYGEGKMKEALAIQNEANSLIAAWKQIGTMETEKEILCQLGFDFGHARAPFAILTDEQKQYIRENITSKL